MYDKIRNPETNRQVNINSKLGRNILHNAAAKTPSNKLIFGEYFGNNKNDAVNIYSLDLESKKLELAYTFDKG